jgi:hypothetical protein
MTTQQTMAPGDTVIQSVPVSGTRTGEIHYTVMNGSTALIQVAWNKFGPLSLYPEGDFKAAGGRSWTLPADATPNGMITGTTNPTTMRDLILARIAELTADVSSGGIQTAFTRLTRRERGSLSNQRKAEIIANGSFYPGFDFSTLSDADLVRAFEKLVRCYYKQWG